MNGGKLRAADFVVIDVPLVVGTRLVSAYHYAGGGSNTATYLHGLFKRDSLADRDCLGVAWWIPPTKTAAHATYPADWRSVLSLSRLVVHPGVPGNAASFLIGRSMRLIDRSRWPCLVTYADKWRGHNGAIYRATNWREVGETKPESTYTINGVMRGRKRGGVTLTHDEMMAAGAEYHGKHSRIKFVHIAERAPIKRELSPALHQARLIP